jgi:hypothetical protein
MQVTYGSVAEPGHVNEDRVVAGNSWVAVLDGASPRAGVESGCIHDVPWLVAQLAAGLTHVLGLDGDVDLDDALAQAINTTIGAHESTCDLDNPDSPSSTAAVIRSRLDGRLDFLVLADSPILVQRTDGTLTVITDDRSAGLGSYTAESVRAARNSPTGFWVASTTAEAARHAVTGTIPAGEAQAVALMTDGVSRYVDRLGLGSWGGLMSALCSQGPLAVIDQVRAAELAQLPPLHHQANGRMVKRHDDATAVVALFQTQPSEAQ